MDIWGVLYSILIATFIFLGIVGGIDLIITETAFFKQPIEKPVKNINQEFRIGEQFQLVGLDEKTGWVEFSSANSIKYVDITPYGDVCIVENFNDGSQILSVQSGHSNLKQRIYRNSNGSEVIQYYHGNSLGTLGTFWVTPPDFNVVCGNSATNILNK